MLLMDYRYHLKLIKIAEKSIVRNVVAQSMITKRNSQQSMTNEVVTREISNLKTSMNNITEALGSSVKGKFGDSVRETLQNQTEKLNDII